MPEQNTTIKVSRKVLEVLKEFKVHPRESFNSMFEREFGMKKKPKRKSSSDGDYRYNFNRGRYKDDDD